MAAASTLFNVQDAFRSAYAARIAEFTEAGRQAGLAPATEDHERIAVILVDYQHDFVDPTGTLSVPGARDDVARFLTWFYASAHRITTVYVSLDTHLPYHIFYSSWWRNAQTGDHPQPFTVITEDDVLNGVWEPVSKAEQEWSRQYVHRLRQEARKELMIWPYHTMQGTLGHMLSAPISEAIAWHSAARNRAPLYIVKGLTPRTEYYGIFGAEIPDSPESDLNISLLDTVMAHDKIYIAGEAKSHCVLETERQIARYCQNRPELLQRVYALKDCTSSVQNPAIDFDALAEAELTVLKQAGMHMIMSTEGV
jgi:nicotinamidase-related amidase